MRLCFVRPLIVFIITSEMHSTQGQEASSLKRAVILMFILLIYLHVGALMFSTIEHSHHKDRRKVFLTYLEDFMGRFGCLNSSDVDDFIAMVTSSSVDGTLHSSAFQERWTFTNSLFFATTVVTTIGKFLV